MWTIVLREFPQRSFYIMEERRLSAIMFTDIAGYTAMMGKDTKRAMEIVRRSKEIQRPLVEKYGGKWLKEMGDGLLIQFNTALDAVQCALDIQKTCNKDFEAQLRIGVHLGDITIEKDDVYGDGVNVAARLQSVADPGGIYISESIEMAIRGQINVQVKFLGEIRFKNVVYGVRTYALQESYLPIPKVKNSRIFSGRFWAELHRRNVLLSGITYVIFSILIIIIIAQFQFPTSIEKVILIFLIIGFPIALYLAWNYEFSPKGFVQTTSMESWRNPYKSSQKKPLTSSLIIIVCIFLVFVAFLYPRLPPLTNKKEKAPEERSIAVLPFINDSPDEDNIYFCNGMMEEIINDLQKITGLNVASRTSVEQYRSTDRDIKIIGEELGVSYLVEGSVRKSGDNLRITTQLIDANTGSHLWSEIYDGKYSERIFDFQSTIAREVVSSLQVVITPEEQQRIDKQPTDEILAWDLYQRGMDDIEHFSIRRDQKYLKSARQFFFNALEIDHDYSQAYYGIGFSYYWEKRMDSAVIYANKAISTNSEYFNGYALKGYIFKFQGKTDLALEHLNKALELAPSNNWINYSIGDLYLYQKKDVEKGFYYIVKSFKLGGEAQKFMYGNIGTALSSIGYYEKAENYFRSLLNMQLNCTGIEGFLYIFQAQGMTNELEKLLDSTCIASDCEFECNRSKFHFYLINKEYEVAQPFFNEYIKLLKEGASPIWPDSLYITFMYKQLGDQLHYSVIADELFSKNTSKSEENMNFETCLNYAGVYAIEGNRNQALEYLTKAQKIGYIHDIVEKHPIFENLWNDPRFKAIMTRAREEKNVARKKVQEMEKRGEIDL